MPAIKIPPHSSRESSARLEVCGNNDFDRDFYLPGDLTASELASWAAEIADAEESRSDDDSELTPEQRAEIIDRERKTIGRTTELYLTPRGRDRLITAIEGAGKTQGLLDSMSSEMLDRAMDAPDHAPQHFMCYAARSKQQAIEKRREYDERRSPFDCKTVVPGVDPNPRSLRNFPMQANGAEMLRLACILGMEAGIKICAPVHDAILIEAESDAIDEQVRIMQKLMATASAIVLGSFELRSDVKIIPSSERYPDPKGR